MTLIRDLDETKYQNLSDKFYIKEKNFTYQYAPLYSERLTAMKEEIKNACLKKWSNKYPIKGLVDLEKDEKCIIIGTLYKEMKLKPNILKELAEDENNGMIMQPVVHRGRYIDESDQLILEDELQRILLVDANDNKCDSIVSKNKLCTGLVIALLGVENEKSQFEVEDVCFKQTPLIELKEKKFTEDKYIVFMSGIELGDEKTNENLYKFQLFIDFLGGDFVNLNENSTDYENKVKNMLKSTIRLIIAGNSLASTTQSKDMHQKAKYLTKNFIAGSVSCIKELDNFMHQLISKIEVDIMPGEYDPTNLMMPQQPLHHAMFTQAKRCNADQLQTQNFHTATNPYRFSLNDVCILGTSGQLIDDIKLSTSVDDPIEIMKMTLEAGHLAPTCPDTLACYPFFSKDPFILSELPHVYFVGNQNEFKHEVFREKVQLLSIPKFSVTNSVVFLNLNTFESEEVFF